MIIIKGFEKYFGKQLRAARLRKGLTQGQVAARVQVCGAHISHYENGKKVPSLHTFRALCVSLSVDANKLLGIKFEGTVDTDNFPTEAIL